MVYRIEILTYIHLSKPLIAVCELPCPLQRLVSALVYTTGITVTNLKVIKHRMADTHHCMEGHSLWKRGGTDDTLLGVINREEMVMAKNKRSIKQLLAHLNKILVKTASEFLHSQFPRLSLGCTKKSLMQILQTGYPRHQIAHSLHHRSQHKNSVHNLSVAAGQCP